MKRTLIAPTALVATAVACSPSYAFFDWLFRGVTSAGDSSRSSPEPEERRKKDLQALLSKASDDEKEAVFALQRRAAELQQLVQAQQSRLKTIDDDLLKCKTSKP